MDRAQLLALAEQEETVLEALRQAVQTNRLLHVHFSPAWDVTAARITALRAKAEQSDDQQ